MTTTTMQNLRPNVHCFSVKWPRKTVAEVDKVRGKYVSRSMYILRLVEEHLKENKEVLIGQKIPLQGPSVSSTDNQESPMSND